MGIEVPERAEYIRVIMAELTRIQSHLISIGFLLNDLGAFFTPMLYCLEGREKILDLFEMASGSRMTCNYMRPGGVREDLPEGWLDKCQGDRGLAARLRGRAGRAADRERDPGDALQEAWACSSRRWPAVLRRHRPHGPRLGRQL